MIPLNLAALLLLALKGVHAVCGCPPRPSVLVHAAHFNWAYLQRPLLTDDYKPNNLDHWSATVSATAFWFGLYGTLTTTMQLHNIFNRWSRWTRCWPAAPPPAPTSR